MRMSNYDAMQHDVYAMSQSLRYALQALQRSSLLATNDVRNPFAYVICVWLTCRSGRIRLVRPSTSSTRNKQQTAKTR